MHATVAIGLIVGVMVACPGLSVQAADAAPTRVAYHVMAKKAAKGTLKVSVTGSGSYTVTGQRVRKRANRSKSFKLAVGTYRIKAAGATVTPGKVTVRKGKSVKVAVVFATPAPTPPALIPVDPPAATAPSTRRISTSATGGQGDQGSEWPVWSPDGTRIAFPSNATNLVPGDTNGQLDIFVKTLATGAIQRVSTDGNGRQANGASYSVAWSPDSMRIAFASRASNLVTGDSNNLPDIFIKTLATGATQIVSSSPFELWAPEPGNHATRSVRATPSLGGFLGSNHPAWSPDGQRIAFDSDTSNLVVGDSNNRSDIFVKTLATSGIPGMQRVSTATDGSQGNGASFSPAWSPDGKKLAFESRATDLVPSDTNARDDIFVKTLANGQITRISTNAAGNQAVAPADGGSFGARWSPDGARIMFTSDSTNLVPADTNDTEEIFIKTLASGDVQRVATNASGGQAAGPLRSDNPQWSPDGRQVVFESGAPNLVPGDTNGISDIFVKTLATGAIKRVSTDSAGAQSVGGHQGSSAPYWAPDGSSVAFFSSATNLVPGDTNATYDVFVKRL